MALCFALLAAAIWPWIELTQLGVEDYWALLPDWWTLSQFTPVAKIAGSTLLLIALSAALGMLVVAVLRLINRRPGLVLQALLWAFRIIRPSFPVLSALALATAIVSMALPLHGGTGIIIMAIASIYFSMSCLRPTLVARTDDFRWWRPYFPPWRVLGLATAFGTCSWAISGWIRFSSGPSLWLACVDFLVPPALSYLAFMVLVLSLSPHSLWRLLQESRLGAAIAAAIDLEVRLAFLTLIALSPLVSLGFFVIYLAPGMEASFDHIETSVPVIVRSLINLGRGMTGGYVYVLWAIALPYCYLASARLLWLIFAPAPTIPATATAQHD